ITMAEGAVRSSRRKLPTAENTETTSSDRSRSSSESSEQDGADTSLQKILQELRDFRQDSKQQLTDIKRGLSRVNKRLGEAKRWIKKVETRVLTTETVIKKLLQRQNTLETKLTDQEGRSRRDNIWMDGIPEESEATFLETVLRGELDLPKEVELRIERAQRALEPRLIGPDAKPPSIVTKFLSYKIKEVLRKGRQTVFKKHMEFSEVKKALKSQKIQFQTPFPARLRLFYEDSTCQHSAAEATKDMAER
uniref:L1 transposable element RRM domain-containing protein n=1 Tax=Lepisosteus oculatus TaxID=7918 RepID=W5LX52_LEPOC